MKILIGLGVGSVLSLSLFLWLALVWKVAVKMDEPRKINAIIEWVAVEGPRICRCGHEHYGRVNTTGRVAFAPQWGYCEDDTCPCTGCAPPEATERSDVEGSEPTTEEEK